MKSIILFLILAAIILVNAQSDDPYRVELLEPRGFRVLHPGSPNLEGIAISGGYINGSDSRISYSSFSQRADGWWVYENINTSLNPGDILSYTISEFTGSCGVMYDKDFYVPVDAPRVPAQHN